MPGRRPIVLVLWVALGGLGCGDSDAVMTSDAGADASQARDDPDGGSAVLDAGGQLADGAPGSNADAGVDEQTAMATGAEVEAFCDAFIDRVCEWWSTCRGDGGGCDGWGGLQMFEGRCEALPGEVEAGRLSLDLMVADSCTAEPFSCEVGIWEQCSGVTIGNVEPEGDCYYGLLNDECIGGYCSIVDQCPGSCIAFAGRGDDCDDVVRCEQGDVCNNGSCALAPELGEDCSDTGICAEGLMCPPPGQRCVEQVSLGEDCDLDHVCEYGLSCGSSGQCREKIVGDVCQQDAQCGEANGCRGSGDDPLCVALLDHGTACNPDTDFCEKWGECADYDDGDGVVCHSEADVGESCATRQCFESWCRYPPGDPSQGAGVCTAQAAEGGDCSSAMGPQFGNRDSCEPGLWCNAGTCLSPGAEGGVCDSVNFPICQADLWCDVDTCKALGGEGDDCLAQRQSCAFGLWCDNDLKCRQPSGLGGPCDAYISICQDAVYCELGDSDPYGTCQARLDPGADCDPFMPPRCALEHWCVEEGDNADSCQPFANTGQCWGPAS